MKRDMKKRVSVVATQRNPPLKKDLSMANSTFLKTYILHI